MSEMFWDEFWWNNITGAQAVVSKVVDALLENKMVVLKVPSDLPWRYSMRSSICTAFRDRSNARDVVIKAIDIVDDNPEKLEPGRFLLNKYASSSIARGYREKSKVSIQDYITQKEVIRNQILWIKGLDEASAGGWIEFCRKFTPKTATEGLFVLEIHGKVAYQENRFMDFIDFSECVSSYDVQLFNSFVLEEEDAVAYQSELWKKYISTTAAVICDVDAEVSEVLLREVDFREESAIDGIGRIAEMDQFSRRGTEADSGHVLWLYRNHKRAELDHRIWVSQVQILFPVIEMERIEFIEKYRDSIRQVLEENCIEQYSEQITDPMEVELGTLCFMMSCKKKGMYMLYIPDENDRERIRFLHKCRNLIAHASICNPEQVRRLLD